MTRERGDEDGQPTAGAKALERLSDKREALPVRREPRIPVVRAFGLGHDSTVGARDRDDADGLGRMTTVIGPTGHPTTAWGDDEPREPGDPVHVADRHVDRLGV